MNFHHILVPVDFSECSLQAFEAALALASKLKSDVSILHCIDLPSGWENWPHRAKDENPFFLEREKKAIGDLKDLYEKVVGMGLEAKTHLSTSSVSEAVEAKLKSESIDLVVMGSHGVSAKQEYFIGSNAQKVLRKIKVPLLVLKSGLPAPINFKRGLFASSLIEADKEALLRFAEFGKAFGMEELHIVAVDTANYFSQPGFIMIEALKGFKESISGLEVFTSFQKDTSVEAGVRHYSEDKHIELIGISNREKHPIKRIFIGSNVEMLINHCPAPVMSLDWN